VNKKTFRAFNRQCKNDKVSSFSFQEVFQYLHKMFGWILKASGERYTEKVLVGPPVVRVLQIKSYPAGKIAKKTV